MQPTASWRLQKIKHDICVSGENFVTRKISRSVAKIHLGQQQSFSLGNLDSKRDWGHARDYVEVRDTDTQTEPHTQAPTSIEAIKCNQHRAACDSQR